MILDATWSPLKRFVEVGRTGKKMLKIDGKAEQWSLMLTLLTVE